MTHLPDDFRDFLEALNGRQVRYLIAGAFALAAHGHPRYTKDLDIWVEISLENAGRLVAVLQDFGMGSLGLTENDFMTRDVVVQLGYEPTRIDILTGLSGVEFDAAYPHRVMARMADLSVPVVDLETFKANKRATGRLRDLADLEELE